jgi:hypothetical protein
MKCKKGFGLLALMAIAGVLSHAAFASERSDSGASRAQALMDVFKGVQLTIGGQGKGCLDVDSTSADSAVPFVDNTLTLLPVVCEGSTEGRVRDRIDQLVSEFDFSDHARNSIPGACIQYYGDTLQEITISSTSFLGWHFDHHADIYGPVFACPTRQEDVQTMQAIYKQVLGGGAIGGLASPTSDR